MGCDCGKKASVQAPPRSASDRVAAAQAADRVVMYDVYDADGAFVASYSNPVTARGQARRNGGTVAPPRVGGSAPLTLPGTPPAENPIPDAAVATG